MHTVHACAIVHTRRIHPACVRAQLGRQRVCAAVHARRHAFDAVAWAEPVGARDVEAEGDRPQRQGLGARGVGCAGCGVRAVWGARGVGCA
eukprot:6818157-Prymnesium_polylepis.1